MPSRRMRDSNGYRYGYQGQFAERDEETGLDAFELRLWDSRIGRWLSPDPYGEFASPYLGMGNNPISLTDPDGGMTDCPDCGDWRTDQANELNGVTVTAINKFDSGPLLTNGTFGIFAGLPDLNFALPNDRLGYRDFRAPRSVPRLLASLGADPLAPGVGGRYYNPEPAALSIDFDFVTPNSITDANGVKHFGKSISFGIVTDDFGQFNFFKTSKLALEPGVLFGVGIQASNINKKLNTPFVTSDFGGVGFEASGSAIIGISGGTNIDVFNATSTPTYSVHGIQYGIGLPIGYGNLITNTTVFK